MIGRLWDALRRLAREFTTRNEFSAAWHRDQERAGWQSDLQGAPWQADKLDYETWKPGRS